MGRFWIVEDDINTDEQVSDLLAVPGTLALENWDEISNAWAPLIWAINLAHHGNPVAPPDFPVPRIRMPLAGFAPDRFWLGDVVVASHLLRWAMDQPPSVIQYLPLCVTEGGLEVFAQDYAWMNIIAIRPAVDMRRSRYELDESQNLRTGRRASFIRRYCQMVLRDDLGPTPEIFRVAEDLTTVLATEALADRVQRAGCTGISFLDPETYGEEAIVRRYRERDGTRVEWMGRAF